MRQTIGVLLMLVVSACGGVMRDVRQAVDREEWAVERVLPDRIEALLLGAQPGAAAGWRCVPMRPLTELFQCTHDASGIRVDAWLDGAGSIESLTFDFYAFEHAGKPREVCPRFDGHLARLTARFGPPKYLQRTACDEEGQEKYGACAVWKSGGNQIALSASGAIESPTRLGIGLQVAREHARRAECTFFEKQHSAK